jgi:hypothetical protein
VNPNGFNDFMRFVSSILIVLFALFATAAQIVPANLRRARKDDRRRNGGDQNAGRCLRDRCGRQGDFRERLRAEEVYGKPYADALAELVFRPLGMTRSAVRPRR